MSALLELERVSKSFLVPSAERRTVREHLFGLFSPRRSFRLPVLEEVSLAIAQGETVALMGRNGSGKTTLLRLLCGILQPDRGRVIRRAPVTPILELGIGWNPDLDAVDNILLVATLMGLSLRQARAAVEEILDFAELSPFARLELKHYSTGMASRLAYAVAFHAVREVLILDEVLAVGDAGFRRRCEERYRRLAAEGRTILLVSHAPAVVSGFCRRGLLLERGRIVKDAGAEEVAQDYLALLEAPAA